MSIQKITANKKDYLDLLLLADEQEDMIDHYLERGDLFVLFPNRESFPDNELVSDEKFSPDEKLPPEHLLPEHALAECVVTKELTKNGDFCSL